MGGRKFFVTVVAIFSLLFMSLPVYAVTIPYGGSVSTSPTDPGNPLNIDGIIWRYDPSLNYDGSSDLLPFEVDFLSGSGVVLSFVNSGAVTPADITNGLYVNYWNGNYDTDPSVLSASLSIDDFADPTTGLIPFSLTGNNKGENIGVTGTINFTPIPIPGAIWLLGSGMIGLAGLRKKFRTSE